MTLRSTNARGYGRTHKLIRQQWAPQVATGAVKCARCHQPITPTDKWDLDHSDDRTTYLGPAHRSCNRAINAARVGNYPYTQQPPTVIREW